MKPKWFEEVSIIPKSTNRKELSGANGYMKGKQFDTMHFTIEQNKLGTPQTYMLKTNNGWYPIEKLKLNDSSLKMSFDWGFEAQPAETDLLVLKQVAQLLSTEELWHQQDDRECEDDDLDQKWSLYCLVKHIYLQETGDFNHRAFGLNIIREEISLINPKRKYAHQMMEFNNEASFVEVQNLLKVCIARLERKLGK